MWRMASRRSGPCSIGSGSTATSVRSALRPSGSTSACGTRSVRCFRTNRTIRGPVMPPMPCAALRWAIGLSNCVAAAASSTLSPPATRWRPDRNGPHSPQGDSGNARPIPGAATCGEHGEGREAREAPPSRCPRRGTQSGCVHGRHVRQSARGLPAYRAQRAAAQDVAHEVAAVAELASYSARPAASPSQAIPEQLFRRLDGLKSQRQLWEADWQDVVNLLVPGADDILHWRAPGQSRTEQIFDARPLQAPQILAANIQGGITNPAMQWSRLRFRAEELNTLQHVNAWLEACDDSMRSLYNGSRFYQAAYTDRKSV